MIFYICIYYCTQLGYIDIGLDIYLHLLLDPIPTSVNVNSFESQPSLYYICLRAILQLGRLMFILLVTGIPLSDMRVLLSCFVTQIPNKVIHICQKCSCQSHGVQLYIESVPFAHFHTMTPPLSRTT